MISCSPLGGVVRFGLHALGVKLLCYISTANVFMFDDICTLDCFQHCA
jgi:hypothetical protein